MKRIVLILMCLLMITPAAHAHDLSIKTTHLEPKIIQGSTLYESLLNQINELKKQLEELQKKLDEKEEAIPVNTTKEQVIEEQEVFNEAKSNANVTKKGEEWEVSTIFGTGTASQTERTMDRPIFTQIAKNGDIYFIDGGYLNTKLRKFDGKKITTVANLTNNKKNKKGRFVATGLVQMGKNLLMFSDTHDVYFLDGGRIHSVPGNIPKYMEDNRLSMVYRMRKIGDEVYIMFQKKVDRHGYHIAKYDVEELTITPILNDGDYFQPNSFYVYEDSIYVGDKYGNIYREQMHPRATYRINAYDDRLSRISDLWINEDGNLMYSVLTNYEAYVMMEEDDELYIVTGDKRGYQDGLHDEVQMDDAMDFVYDGSGYIFVDPGNNVIRKLWTDIEPMDDL